MTSAFCCHFQHASFLPRRRARGPSPLSTTNPYPLRHLYAPHRRAKASASLPSNDPLSTALKVEQTLRSLGADTAADAAYVQLDSPSPPPLPETWPAVLSALSAASVVGEDLSRVITRAGVPYVLSLDPPAVSAVLLLLAQLGFSRAQVVRVIAQRPSLLADADEIRHRVDLLRGLHFTDRDVRNVAAKWPGLLALDSARAEAIIAFLCRKDVGFTKASLRSLVRRAPWVLVYDCREHVAPAIFWLEKSFLSRDHSLSLEHIIRASPHVLGMSPKAMSSVIDFLRKDILLDEERIYSVVKQFPPMLTSSVEKVLAPAANFLFQDLELGYEEVGRIVRAFPAILTLNVVTDMERNVAFLQSRGFTSIGRIVARLPPVLSYDIETNLGPKMDFLENGLGLTAYDVLMFPGFFSYSLTAVIEPRTRFLQKIGIPVTDVGLNMALAPTDEIFCERIVDVPLDHYVAFRAALDAKRATLASCSQTASSSEVDQASKSKSLSGPEFSVGTAVVQSPAGPKSDVVGAGAAKDVSPLVHARSDDAGLSTWSRRAVQHTGRRRGASSPRKFDSIASTPFERVDESAVVEARDEPAEKAFSSPPASLPTSLKPVTPPRERRRKRRLRATDARLPWSKRSESTGTSPASPNRIG